MPTYNSILDRTDAGALIPEEVYPEIFQSAVQNSAFLSLFKRLPNMSRKQQRMPVLSAMPTAYFVNGDNGLKQTTDQAWANKYLYAEEIACIVPIPEAVLDDADYDIWSEVRPRIGEAFGKVIDAAIGFGTNKPAAWPNGIITDAGTAGNVITLGTGVDLYDDLLGENGVLSAVEQDGFMVNGHVAALTMKAKLRGLRDADGVPIFSANMKEANTYSLDGAPINFPLNGFMNPATALLISGAFGEAVFSIRQDMTFKILTEAVIQDGAGAIVYNLAQQDMVALRAVMRLAWQIPNPINNIQGVEANRYPFGVLIP
jgi:HK97 family phage major capsid protein